MFTYLKSAIRWSVLIILLLTLQACVRNTCPTPPQKRLPLSTQSYLHLGKHYFEQGYYKKAMHELLPLACDGVAEAQYAVGYMYYYGYGVCKDPNVGIFWIKRSAAKGFPPAIRALELIEKQDGCKKPCNIQTYVGKDPVGPKPGD